MKFTPALIILFLAIYACAPVNKARIIRDVQQLEADYQHHSGFVLFDPQKEEYLVDYHGDKYFTPASNTKILTLYTALRVLGDSLPGLYYVENQDSLIFWGTGDPSFLNEVLPSSKVFSFLQSTDKDLYFATSNYFDQHFGPGWAWDDYLYTFSSEKSPLPIYGNNFEVTKTAQSPYLQLEPPFFKQFFWLGDTLQTKSQFIRAVESNHTLYLPSSIKEGHFKEQVPFRVTGLTTAALLTDTLGKKVTLINKPLPANYKTLHSIPVDSAYQVMMQESDNFIAEQLLLLCSGILTDSMEIEKAIDYATTVYLQDMPDPPVWLDGSGLSRYNLGTPRSFVWLWHQIYKEVPRARLISLLAAGGQSGTLKYYYKNSSPYIYGKTGTLSNNHNMSGYLITKKGRLYIFAFMNNNYPVKAIVIKKRIEQVLHYIYLNH